MQGQRLTKLPETLRRAITSLPIFYLLEFLGRNPGTWEDVRGFAYRVGLSDAEAQQALDYLEQQRFVVKQRTLTDEPIYRLTSDPERRTQVLMLADQANRSRNEFLEFVREILRLQLGERHA